MRLLDQGTELSCWFNDGLPPLPLHKVANVPLALHILSGVWKPGVQLVGAPATGPAPQGQTYTQTSLIANPVAEDSHWDVKHNITAKAFTAGETAPGFRSVAAPVSWNGLKLIIFTCISPGDKARWSHTKGTSSTAGEC